MHNKKFWWAISFNSKRPTKCLTLKNILCQARPALANINSGETLFYPFTVSGNKCGGSFKSIKDPYAVIRVPNKVKNMNLKEFNLTSAVNEPTFLVQHESCDCKCRLHESVCDLNQIWM